MTARRPIRVGVLGANLAGSWATTAHLPALQVLDGFEVAAVASTRIASASAVAERYSIPLAFGDPGELVKCPEVDVVAVTVKAPAHAQLIRAAVEAGKDVLCEWPLAVDLQEAQDLADLVAAAGVRHFAVLQAFHSPGARQVRQLIDSGRIGQVTGVSLVGLTPSMGGPEIGESIAYTADAANGATLLSSSGGHAMAALAATVGCFTEVSSEVVTFHDSTRISGTDTEIPNNAPREVTVVGRLTGGVVATMALHGATPLSAPRFTLRISGTGGLIEVLPKQLGWAVNVADWSIRVHPNSGCAEPVDFPADAISGALPAGPARSIAYSYQEYRTAVDEDRSPDPDFGAALHMHRVVEAIGEAAASGRRQSVGQAGGQRC